jgi:hypothetical protein
MKTALRHLWDRQKGESPAAYARFLCYRNLGPARSLEDAYRRYLSSSKGQGDATGETAGEGGDSAEAGKGRKRPVVPGSWKRECSRYGWPARAAAARGTAGGIVRAARAPSR